MKRSRVEKVWSEMARLQSAISALYEAAVNESGQPDFFYHHFPRETGAVRRASMDLTRALADMRKSDYTKLPGEKI